MSIKSLIETIKKDGILRALGTLEELYKLATENESRLTALTSQLESVVAENAALKAFGDKLDEMHNDLNGEGTGIQGRAEVACQQVALEAAMEEFDAIKTPATSAFLAEVRASAVEKCAEHLLSNDDIGVDSEYPIIRQFAAQLRQGNPEIKVEGK